MLKLVCDLCKEDTADNIRASINLKGDKFIVLSTQIHIEEYSKRSLGSSASVINTELTSGHICAKCLKNIMARHPLEEDSIDYD